MDVTIYDVLNSEWVSLVTEYFNTINDILPLIKTGDFLCVHLVAKLLNLLEKSETQRMRLMPYKKLTPKEHGMYFHIKTWVSDYSNKFTNRSLNE